MKRKIKIAAFLLLIPVIAFTQEFGGGIVINPQTESLGLNIRAHIPISRFTIAPQFSYYPFFNKVSEFYLGASAHYDFMESRKMRMYGIVNASYNSWMNYDESPLPNAQQTNWGLEFGAGIKGKKCVKPFAEYRYNIKWRETNLTIGILFDLACNSRSAGYGTQRERKAVSCPGH